MSIRSYFNLNLRSAKSHAAPLAMLTISKAENVGLGTPAAPAAQTVIMPLWEQVLMYVGTVIGVLFSSAIMSYKAGEDVNLRFSTTTLVVTAVIALLVTPSVFEKLKVSPDTPLMARLALFAQHGVFWQVLLEALRKTIA